MAYEFKLPDLGEGLTEGEIARWLVSEGQEIGEDDPLVEVQTDKTTVEIPSPAGGRVERILVGEGDVVPVGTVLVVIADGAAPAASTEEQPRAEPAVAQTGAPAAAFLHRATAACVRRRWCGGWRRSSGSTSRRSRRRARRDASRRTTCAVLPRARLPRRPRRPPMGDGFRCAASAASPQSTWRARTPRCRPSPGSRSATSRASRSTGSCLRR